MQNKVLLTAISIAAIVGFLFIVYYFMNGSDNKSQTEAYTIKSSDHIKWDNRKKNILVEYSDFQCPACKVFHEKLKKIEPKNITFVYRHYPLTQHTNALLAAYASEAAGRQNKFFAMADLLFGTQTDWANLQNPKDFFINLAKKLNLNLDQFKKDIDSTDVKNKVQEELLSGDRVGVQATPTFFLNGKKLEFGSFDEFKKLLLNAEDTT